MLNFLPQKNKKQIIFEYSLRIMSFLMLFVFISCLMLITLFFPSFFFVKYKNDIVNEQFASIQQKNISKGEDPSTFIKNVNRLSLALSASTSSDATYSDIINKIVSLKNKDIKILSINITDDSKLGNRKILLNGVAKTRDSLTLFDTNIKADGFFKSVVFPVSNFIKSSDSEFSATLIL